MNSREISEYIRKPDYLFLATYWAQASKNWKKLAMEATDKQKRNERLKKVKECRLHFLRCCRLMELEKFKQQLGELGL